MANIIAISRGMKEEMIVVDTFNLADLPAEFANGNRWPNN